MVSIWVVHTTLGKHGNYNSGSKWDVTLTNGERKTLSREVAMTLVTNNTQYGIQYYTKIYRVDDKLFYNIKWRGFKNISIINVK